MEEPATESANVVYVREALALDQFSPERLAPPVGLPDQSDAKKIFSAYTVASVDAFPGTTIISLHKDGSFAAKITTVLVGPDRAVSDAIADEFAVISGPVFQLERQPHPDFDLVAQLSHLDNFVVVSKGRLVVSANTMSGHSAMSLATKTASALFPERQ